MPTEYDSLQRFVFESARVRGEIVRLQASYQAVLQRHPYPPVIGNLLGEALTAAALLSATIKFTGSLTLQVQGDGPVGLLVVQSSDQYHLRGLAKWHGDITHTSFSELCGQGHLAITITPAEGERYQGVVDLRGENLAATLEGYFSQSEQLPTCLCLFADQQVAAGLLLQVLPGSSEMDQQHFWEHLVHLTRTLKAEELLHLPNQAILRRLYSEEDIELFESEPVSFRCSCSVERMERALRLMDRDEVFDILKSHKVVTVTCEFCHYHYNFDAVDVERILADGIVVPGEDRKH